MAKYDDEVVILLKKMCNSVRNRNVNLCTCNTLTPKFLSVFF